MKKLQWLQLTALNLLVIVCMFLPYLPGPYDKLSYGLSFVAQLTGFAGLLLVPIGILWLIQEINKIAGNNKPLNNWSNGYNYAITATCVCTFIGLILLLGLFVGIGPSAAVIGLIVIGFTLYRVALAIKNFQAKINRQFNATPLYLLSIPAIAFLVYMFLLGPVRNYSRNYAITQAEKLIYAIEDYLYPTWRLSWIN